MGKHDFTKFEYKTSTSRKCVSVNYITINLNDGLSSFEYHDAHIAWTYYYEYDLSQHYVTSDI